MKVWIDLANAPHVAFFLPIIQKLRASGHHVMITLRDFNNTVEIAREHGITGHVVGKHGGKSDFGKLVNLAVRSLQLARLGRSWKPDVAVSHNSYTHTIAGRLVGSRVITVMDYEGQPANHIAFRVAHSVIVPDCFPESALQKFGVKSGKVYRYSGFKEQLYLSDYKPKPRFVDSFRDACNLTESWNIENNVVVTVRTPATMAAYHHFQNQLFGSLLKYLNERSDLTVAVLPRNSEQREHVKTMFSNLKIPNQPLIGSDLVYHSDVVISAGGTMNREAAILGTPVHTIFGGKLPAVDQRLIELGRLNVIHSMDDLVKIKFAKKTNREILQNSGLCDEIVQQILSVPRSRDIKYRPKNGIIGSSCWTASRARLFRTYYVVKRFIPRRIQVEIRRYVARRKRFVYRRSWPINEAAGRPPGCFRGWPDGRRFAFVLRHDVESPLGLSRVRDLVRMESRLGFKSAFFLVPKAYEVSQQLLEQLKESGNEIGVHGWNHDGKLYLSRSIFEKRAERINGLMNQWKAVGFASPSAHHHFEWLHRLNIKYDTSSFDTDPFEPQPDGVGSIYPLLICGDSGAYVELPYTLPQDFTLFVILQERNAGIWKEKLDWIAEKGGMAFVNSHPDYMSFKPDGCGRFEYKAELYNDFLEYVSTKYKGLYWHALPREVEAFWREKICDIDGDACRSVTG